MDKTFIEIHPGVWILASAVQAIEVRVSGLRGNGPPNGTIVTLSSGARIETDEPIESILQWIINNPGHTSISFDQFKGNNYPT